ncbi:MAG TPA: L,D-transpeptidase [Hyphomicrobiaceae bacterium]|nr:L,D-transpeptidase [Hyphomicrobiaceae bacterium]
MAFKAKYPIGAIVVVNDDRRLFYVLGDGRAIRYPIAVGSEDNLWTGQSFVQSKAKDPKWIPPWEPEREVEAGPDNPLGPRAIYLGWTLYRIHGTNSPRSIGGAASSGCFRMYNHHAKDLYERVHIGAPVYVVDSLDD